ncbi:hypothetical protein VTJ83DRAFT_6390 [Remersonia thermophila]|uniref:DUF642 domain-containing protein n=1 Tax=Remersonia thermophila TaxID=72144 RepID=A0ABR4D5G8_9PEZI
MKFLAFLATLTGALAAPAPAQSHDARQTLQRDFFFRYVGAGVIPSDRLRTNTSNLDFISPGWTLPPHSDGDHFARAYPDGPGTRCARTTLVVVPTHPHPGPVPGYYGLTDREGVFPAGEAYRLVYTYRLAEQGPGFKHTAWWYRRTQGAGDTFTRARLRYAGLPEASWRWVAVKTATPAGVEKWVPYLVKKTVTAWPAGLEVVDGVDLEIERATGPVNSNAPGGVQE